MTIVALMTAKIIGAGQNGTRIRCTGQPWIYVP